MLVLNLSMSITFQIYIKGQNVLGHILQSPAITDNLG